MKNIPCCKFTICTPKKESGYKQSNFPSFGHDDAIAVIPCLRGGPSGVFENHRSERSNNTMGEISGTLTFI